MAPKNQTETAETTSDEAAPEEQATKVVHRKVRITRSGSDDTRTARCTCGWVVSGDSQTVTRAKAVHLGLSRRDEG